MKAIPCDIQAAKVIILSQRDALEVNVNPQSYEAWRIRLNDCFAIG